MARACCSFEPEPIPLVDAITLHSWAKWRSYRRLPWKLAFDVVVATLAVVVTVLAVSQTGLYANSCSDAFDNLFGMGPEGETRIYDRDLLSSTVSKIVTRYYSLQTVTLSRLWHERRNGTVVPTVAGYLVMGVLATLCVLVAERGRLFGVGETEVPARRASS